MSLLHVTVVWSEPPDVFCSNFTCPNKYNLVNSAGTTVCAATGCTNDLCCEKDGETAAEPITAHVDLFVRGQHLDMYGCIG